MTSVTTEEKTRIVFKAMKVDLSETRRELKKASPLMSNTVYSIQCQKCERWNFSYHVFCPHCSASVKNVAENTGNFRLISCKMSTCPGHPAYIFEGVEEIRNAYCRHTSRQPKGTNIPLKTIESILASIISSGLYSCCALLSEEDLLEELYRAKYWGYYSSLFSLNSARIYEELGYNRVASEIKKLHNTKKQSSLDTLRLNQHRLTEDIQYLSIHKQSRN